MNRVMPPHPLAAASRGYMTHVSGSVDPIIDVHVPRDVDHHVVVMPVKAAPCIAPGDTDRHPEAEADDPSRNDSSPRIIVVWGVRRPPPRAIDDRRIICRHVNHLGDGRFDDDGLGLWFHDDLLFAGGPQVALGLSLLSQHLDGVHHLILLGKKGIPQLLRPLEPVVHHLQDRGKVHERFHTRVPGLLFQCSRQLVALHVRVFLYPAVRFNDLQGIRGGHQDLHQKLIRIERDGRKHLVQLLLPEDRLPARVRALCHDPPGRCGQQQHQ